MCVARRQAMTEIYRITYAPLTYHGDRIIRNVRRDTRDVKRWRSQFVIARSGSNEAIYYIISSLILYYLEISGIEFRILFSGGVLDRREFTIALAGNPNAGKTTIFNQLTGSKQHVANYPGVTVEKKEGFFEQNGIRFKVVDLPGTYSLSAYSIEEIIARNYIVEEKPDIVVNIIDASNLERNLYLAIQVIELDIPVLFVFNMMDEAKKRGIKINKSKLSKLLNNIKIVETVGNKSKGIDVLKQEIYEFCVESKDRYQPPVINYGEKINNAILSIESILKQSEELISKYNSKWLALKLIEDDNELKKEVLKYFDKNSELFSKINFIQDKIITLYDDPPEIIIAEKRYGFISGICTEAVVNTVEFRHDLSDKIDTVLTNKFLGIPIFLLLMYLTFQLTFSLGSLPMDWIDSFFNALGGAVGKLLPGESMLKALVVQGIIGGVGSVLVFLPNIILLFFAIGILEFTGYMSRAAFLLDKIMHKMGLHGKSFIPMLIGFGCNVPGIMATRTLNTEKERLITILILPLMSCGARLPVYLLIIPAFFPKELQAPIMWLIYLIGIILAIISATLLNKLSLMGEHAPFIMELPPYRIPTFKAVMIYMWEKSYMYVKKAGTIILAISIVLWALSYFPVNVKYSQNYDELIKKERLTLIKSMEEYSTLLKIKKETLIDIFNNNKNNLPANIKKIRDYIAAGRIGEAKTVNAGVANALIKVKLLLEEYNNKIKLLTYKKLSEKAEKSYIGKIGNFLAPIFKPLGFDWRLTTAVIAALPAKEVFVSQLSIINAAGVNGDSDETLRDKIKSRYNPLIGFCVMLWVLIATPCIATLAVTKQETGSWKWAVFQFGGLTLLAYTLTFAVYNLGKFIGFGMS